MSEDSQTGTLRVATWNVWWRHGQWERRQPAILEVLRIVDADIVGLQEACSRDPDHLQWLRDELGYHVAASPDGDDDRFGVVNVLASRWPIVDTSWEYLDVGEMVPHRTVLRATIDSPIGHVQIYCTHLSHGFDQSELRQRQLAQIAELIASDRVDNTTSYPPVLLGDLNAVPGSDEIRQLTGHTPAPSPGLIFTDTWDQVGEGAGVTYSGDNPYVVDSVWPDRRLDYVLVAWPRKRPSGNPSAASLFGVDEVDGVVASDHYGVVVDLRH